MSASRHRAAMASITAAACLVAMPPHAGTGFVSNTISARSGNARSTVLASETSPVVSAQIANTSRSTSSPNHGAPAVFAATACAVGGLVARRQRQSSGRGARQSVVRFGMPWPFTTPEKKTVIITGASSGLGLATAKELASSGEWFVIMACRDIEKAEKVAKQADMPEGSYKVMHCDLSAKDSVRQFVRMFRRLNVPLDSLVCNAAVYFPNAHKQGAFLPGLFPGGGPRWSADGHELSFAANYLGHFLLCNLLLVDLMKSSVKPARCVILGTVTATVNGAELGGMIPPLANIGNLEGLEKGMKAPITMLDGGEFDGAKAYKDSKVCDIMLMRELHRRYHKKTGIVFTSMYPGCIAETGLFREHYPAFQKLFPVFHQNFTKAYVSEAEAGRRLAACVADPDYCTSGTYYSWQGKSGTGGEGGSEAKDNTEETFDHFMNYGSFRTLAWDEIGGEAGDNTLCEKLWNLSEKMLQDSA